MPSLSGCPHPCKSNFPGACVCARARTIVRAPNAMSRLQQIFIAITFAGPVLLWLLSRRIRSAKFARGISTIIVALIVFAYGTALALKWRGEGLDIEGTLPMQLCDWAAFATVLALATRHQAAFELAYFWGLSGTIQALFTPAVTIDGSARVVAFLIVHSAIPAGVLWLMFEYGMRPRPSAVWRALAWSQLYLAATLTVNAMVGANYGFLSAKPANPSLLDMLSDERWLYVLQIDGLAVLFFTALQLPWWFIRPRGTTDA